MDGKSFSEIGPNLVATIVSSYVKHNKVAANDLSAVIASVHQTLSKLGNNNSPPDEPLVPAVPVRQSVRPDYVVCLECGYRAQMLRRHINNRHGLSRIEYLNRWGLKSDHPLTAPAYSEHRSTLAKQLGLGRKPQAEIAGPPRPAEVAVISDEEKADADHTGPKRSTAAGPDDAASQKKRTRQRRSRSRSAPPQSDPSATPTEEA